MQILISSCPAMIVLCPSSTSSLFMRNQSAYQVLSDRVNSRTSASRGKLLTVARIRYPYSRLASPGSAYCASKLELFGPEMVIKLDGTHGGEEMNCGCRWRRSRGRLQPWRDTGLLSAARRLLVHGDPLAQWLWNRPTQAEITIQQYIEGRAGNNMVACWQGEIMAR